MAWFAGLLRAARSWAGSGLDLVCPPRCVFCGAEPRRGARDRSPAARDAAGQETAPAAGRGMTVCPDCRRRLTTDGPRCQRCGEPGLTEQCRRCRGRRHWDGIVVLSAYADDLRDAVLRCKRPAGEVLAATLADLLVQKHCDTLLAWRIGVVVPVPMHWLRRMRRGTSAAGELARGLARGLGVPCRPLLRRHRSTRMQNEFPIEDRPANVRGAFRAVGDLGGARVLLVDDVVTSGATLADCRRALAAAGASAVFAAVVARADHRPPDG